MPMNWVMHHMTQTTDNSVHEQWKEVLELLIRAGGSACPRPGLKMMSAIGQFIHPNIPDEITSLLIEQGRLDKVDVIAEFKYKWNSKKKVLALDRAERKAASEDVNLDLGRGWVRLAMQLQVIVRDGKSPTIDASSR